MVQRLFDAVVEILVVVDVHDKSFACTGCHPEGKFFDISACEVCIHGVTGGSHIVSALDKNVELV